MPSAAQPSAGHRAIATRLSEPRLAPYRWACGGNLKEALNLYRWNVALSGAVYEGLHVFEVVFRNAIDEQLCTWNATSRRPFGAREAPCEPDGPAAGRPAIQMCSRS